MSSSPYQTFLYKEVLVYCRLRTTRETEWRIIKTDLPPLSIAMCRATFKTVAKFIGILSILFSFCASCDPRTNWDDSVCGGATHPWYRWTATRRRTLLLIQQMLTQESKQQTAVPLETSASTTTNTRSSITVFSAMCSDEWRGLCTNCVFHCRCRLWRLLEHWREGEIIGQYDVTTAMISRQQIPSNPGFRSRASYRRQGKKNLRRVTFVERGDICVVCRNEGYHTGTVKRWRNAFTTKTVALTDSSYGVIK